MYRENTYPTEIIKTVCPPAYKIIMNTDTELKEKNDDLKPPFDRKKYMSDYSKKYYEKNKDDIKQYHKMYYDDNSDAIKNTVKINRNKNLSRCKDSCKKYYDNNKEKIKEYQRIYQEKNKENLKKYRIEYKKNNTELIKESSKKSYQKHKDFLKIKQYKYQKNRLDTDPSYKLLKTLRRRILNALKGSSIKKSRRTLDLLGCDIVFAKQHLESKFGEGMSWDNHGTHGWHIDHIRPCVSFDLSDPEQQRECFHYTNLQPLWASENLSKGAKFTPISDQDSVQLA